MQDHAHHSDTFKDKVLKVMAVLRSHRYIVPSTGREIAAVQQLHLVDLINAWREENHSATVRLHAPGLTKYLAHPDQAPHWFVKELTHALGLGDLGETIWRLPSHELIDLVEAKVTGGILKTLTSHSSLQAWHNPKLLTLHPSRHMGIKAFNRSIDHADYGIPEFIVGAEQVIQTKVAMPFRGYLHVLAGENGEFIGLNSCLKVPAELQMGDHRLDPLETDPTVPRTFIFAFASTANLFKRWPKDHDKLSRLSHGQFLQLIKELFAAGDQKQFNVVSFLTTRARAT